MVERLDKVIRVSEGSGVDKSLNTPRVVNISERPSE